MNNINIKIAKKAGFCFGVQRAVDLVEEVLTENEKAYCWGDLVHNPVVIKRLKEKGLIIIKDIDDFPEGEIFIVRSHGMTKEDLSIIKNKTLKIVDTTCPFVIKAQNRAEKFDQQGKRVLVIGDKNHVEVKSLNSAAGGDSIIVNSVDDLEKNKTQLTGKIGVICQTTQKHSKLKEITTKLEQLKVEFEVVNTICLDTTKKQQEVLDVSAPDVLIVIGGLHSSNTSKLAEIGKKRGFKVYHVETASEILQGWFNGSEEVFVTAGASTPPNELTDAEKLLKNFIFE